MTQPLVSSRGDRGSDGEAGGVVAEPKTIEMST